MDYGLWLLIALLVVIGLIFLLSGKRGTHVDAPMAPVAPPPIAEPKPQAPAVATADVDPAPAPVLAPEAAQPAPAIADVAPPVAPAQPVPASPAFTTLDGEVDDLLRLKGVGPKLKTLLIELGVTRYAQIAAWSDTDIATIDTKLGNFRGRPVRDQWIDQARYLAAGDIAGFEAKYGKL